MFQVDFLSNMEPRACAQGDKCQLTRASRSNWLLYGRESRAAINHRGGRTNKRSDWKPWSLTALGNGTPPRLETTTINSLLYFRFNPFSLKITRETILQEQQTERGRRRSGCCLQAVGGSGGRDQVKVSSKNLANFPNLPIHCHGCSVPSRVIWTRNRESESETMLWMRHVTW